MTRRPPNYRRLTNPEGLALAVAVLALVFLLLGGCSGPSTRELLLADYGRRLTDQQVIGAAERWLHATALDPTSVQVRFGEPERGWQQAMLSRPEYGYRVEADVLAKNLFGGYTGWRRMAFIVRDGRVESAWTRTAAGHWNKHR